ncbi:MFS transporter [Paenibacillus radicis (ex Xue et al. 2023)]|uniref:MFS transporter n=1 Tax=Paenibacillus radicis (ex Xue et al. 2023) TaxID=2972489 RepID=A0ABT1YQW0_9BACL|nr:MFS transporter [Paenibacillus radicis (ex Xue et al. 2023)]MCR8635568.1 MFS transporter [Paenibacillus radicis (ex Xue et al. 2023)]
MSKGAAVTETQQVRIPTARRNPYKDGPFWGICIGHAFTHWYPSSMYILLPYIVIAYNFSITQAGLLLTLRSLITAFLTMPIGAFTDMSRKKHLFLAASLFLVGMPFLFIGFVQEYWLFALLFIVMGVGNEFWHPASYTTLSQRFPEQRGLTFGYHAMASNLGDMLAPIVIGALIVTYTWQEIIYWNFVPGVFFAIFILITLRNMNVDPSRLTKANADSASGLKDYLTGLKELLRNKTVVLIAVLSGIRAMAQNGIMILLPLYLAMQMGLNAFWVGMTLGVLQAGGLIAAPIVGRMSDKSGPRKILTTLMVATSIMLVIVSFIRNDWILIGTIAVLGFFLYAIRPVMQAWAMESTDTKVAGTATSLLFSMQSLMGAASPIIGTYLAQTYSFSVAFYFLAGVILAGNLVIHFIPNK